MSTRLGDITLQQVADITTGLAIGGLIAMALVALVFRLWRL